MAKLPCPWITNGSDFSLVFCSLLEPKAAATRRARALVLRVARSSFISFSASFRVRRLLDYVQPRFPGIGNSDRRAIRPELEDLVLAGIITRPFRQSRTVRIARLRKVCPVRVSHMGDSLVLGGHGGPRASSKVVEHVRDFRSVRCTIPHPSLH